MLLTTTNNNLFDTFFSDPWFNDPWFDDRDVQKAQKKLYGHNGKRMMLTDIKESDKGYELEMDLPGFKKDEIKACLLYTSPSPRDLSTSRMPSSA